MTNQIEAKSPLKSKTVWVSILGLVAASLALTAGESWIQEYPKAVAILLMGREIVNLILRSVTTTPLKPIGKGGV